MSEKNVTFATRKQQLSTVVTLERTRGRYIHSQTGSYEQARQPIARIRSPLSTLPCAVRLVGERSPTDVCSRYRSTRSLHLYPLRPRCQSRSTENKLLLIYRGSFFYIEDRVCRMYIHIQNVHTQNVHT